MPKQPKPQKLNGKKYYLASEVYDYDPKSFPGTYKTMRTMIIKKKLEEKDYNWCKIVDEKISESDENYSRAKLLLTEEWVNSNILKEDSSDEDSNSESSNSESSNSESSNSESSEDEKSNIELYIKDFDILELDDNEKFKDKNGKCLKIEVRGMRDRNKCYFRALDIIKEFEMPSLYNTMVNKPCGYKVNKHFVFLQSSYCESSKNAKVSKKSSKNLYLTYSGLVRLLIVSKNKNIQHYHDWVDETLFTVQMGTSEAKSKLASKLIGASSNSIKEFSKTLTKPISCIYLFKIGYVKNLRKSMNIGPEYDDYDIVLKFGRTKDINERTMDHEKDFGSIKGSEFELIYCCYIDPVHTSTAEARIHKYFKLLDKKFKYKNKEELIIVDKNFLKNEIKHEYSDLNTLYGGDIKELNNHMDKLTTDKEILKKDCNTKVLKIQHKLDISNKDYDLLDKDYDLLDKDYELLKKDFEIYKLKYGSEDSSDND